MAKVIDYQILCHRREEHGKDPSKQGKILGDGSIKTIIAARLVRDTESGSQADSRGIFSPPTLEYNIHSLFQENQ